MRDLGLPPLDSTRVVTLPNQSNGLLCHRATFFFANLLFSYYCCCVGGANVFSSSPRWAFVVVLCHCSQAPPGTGTGKVVRVTAGGLSGSAPVLSYLPPEVHHVDDSACGTAGGGHVTVTGAFFVCG